MLDKFTGPDKARHLTTALQACRLVGNDAELAKMFINVGDVAPFSPGEILITEGEFKDDLFILLGGAVDIFVNSHPVATRKAGETVGEMALLEPT